MSTLVSRTLMLAQKAVAATRLSLVPFPWAACHGSALTTLTSDQGVGSGAESRLSFVRSQLRPHFRPQ